MNRLHVSWLCALGLFCVNGQHLHAAAIASDDASTYSGAWTNGENNGSGFGPWQLTATSGNAGFFTFTSQNNGHGDGNIDTNSLSWGLFANSGAESTAVRPFTTGGSNGSNVLGIGQQFMVSLDTGFIDNGNSVGISLQNGTGANELQFLFVGGQNDYTIKIGATTLDTGIGYTSAGMALVFTQGAGNSWNLSVTPNGGTTSTFSDATAGSATLPASDISQVQIFNNNAGNGGSNDSFANSLRVVPEPGVGASLFGAFAMLALFRRRQA
jgi:hypothetical protein